MCGSLSSVKVCAWAAVLVGACAAPQKVPAADSASPPEAQLEEVDPLDCVDASMRANAVAYAAATEALERQATLFDTCSSLAMDTSIVSLRLVVDTDGAWTSPEVTHTLYGSCELVECMREKAEQLELPPAPPVHAPAYEVHFAMRPGAPTAVADSPGVGDDELECLERPKAENDDAVAATVMSLEPRARECYRAAQARDPKVHGQVAFGFSVQTSGRVAEVVVQFNSVPDCQFVDCVKQHGRKLNFPAREEPYVVNVPLDFRRW